MIYKIAPLLNTRVNYRYKKLVFHIGFGLELKCSLMMSPFILSEIILKKKEAAS